MELKTPETESVRSNMEIKYLPINQLKKYKGNPRKNKRAVDIVANSIKEFKFRNPIILDKNNEIVCGHTRILAAEKLGYKELPTIKIDDLTPEQIKAFRIMDNKSQEYASWDMDLLKIELDPVFCSHIVERWENYTQKQAKKLNSSQLNTKINE